MQGLHRAISDFNFGNDYTLDASKFDAKAMETVERCSRLSLPADARGLNMFYQGSGIDDAFVARIQIPEKAVANVTLQIDKLPGKSAHASEDLTKGLTWWNQKSMQIQTQRRLNIGSDYLEVILGEEDNAWILLVKWFST